MPIGLGSIMAGASGASLITGILPPLGRDWTYVTNSVNPNMRYDVSTAIQLRYRDLIPQQDYVTYMRSQGINEDRAGEIFELGKQLLDGYQIIALERRGKIDGPDVLTAIAKIGLDPGTYLKLKEVTEVIPAAGDIISFAVREVYSPEIAEAFGQFEGLDEVVSKAAADIKAIGMTKETFSKYWASHWMLPSVGQGFEMVHRDVIPQVSTEEKPLGLDRLMTALDIMPAWRDKLTAISYSPFTRVDVRRMHKLGILNDEDLVRAYMDLGFDKEKAEAMRDFTIVYNFTPPEVELTAEDTERARQKDLTRADVLAGYRDGLLNTDEANEVLARLGYSEAEVEYYLSRENYRRDAEEVDTQLKYYHDAYVYGVMDFNEVTDRIGALNLPSSRVERLFAVWDLEKLAKSRKPTKAELMTFLRKKVIDKPEFISEMEGLGYPEKYIGWYLQTV